MHRNFVGGLGFLLFGLCTSSKEQQGAIDELGLRGLFVSCCW